MLWVVVCTSRWRRLQGGGGEAFRAATAALPKISASTRFPKRSLSVRAAPVKPPAWWKGKAETTRYSRVFRRKPSPCKRALSHRSGDADRNLRRARSGACRLLTSACVQLPAVIVFSGAPGQRGCSLAAPLICVSGWEVEKNQSDDDSLKFSSWRT